MSDFSNNEKFYRFKRDPRLQQISENMQPFPGMVPPPGESSAY